MTKTLKVEAANWLRFSHFMAGSYLSEREATHYLWQCGSNTGGIVDEANYKALKRDFAAEIAAGDMEDTTIGGGLRGVEIYAFLVRVVDEKGERTELAGKVEAVIKALQDYPLVDEDLFSEMEDEASWENFVEQLRWSSNKFVDVDYSDSEVQGKVHELLDDSDFMSGDDGSWPEEKAIEKALESLGYLRDDSDAA